MKRIGIIQHCPLTRRSTDSRYDCTIATVHYNPCGYRRLRETYYEWLPTLPQQPLCYELVFDDDTPEIEDSIVIRGSRDRNQLWQKEPLLNLALRDCRTKYFCWIDHDIVFSSPTWLSDAVRLMGSKYRAVQLFRALYRLGPDRQVEFKNSATTAVKQGGNPGAAWIAEAEFLRSLGGFPVHCIVGGGDAPMYHRLAAQATFLPETVQHLWHGDKVDRQHESRLQILWHHNYRHGIDTIINRDGLLHWTDSNPRLRREVQEFFSRRKEDG